MRRTPTLAALAVVLAVAITLTAVRSRPDARAMSPTAAGLEPVARATEAVRDDPLAGAGSSTLHGTEHGRSPVAPDSVPVADEPAASAEQAGAAEEGSSGSAEILVLQEDRPRAGAVVRLVRGGVLHASWEAAFADRGGPHRPSAPEAMTDALGKAVFTELAPDRYDVEVELGEVRALVTGHSVGRVRERYVVVLGTAALEGTVFDVDGRPVPGTDVTVFQNGRAGEPIVRFEARTGPSGRYRIAGFAGGDRRLTAALLGREAVFRRIELAPGELRELDLGSPCGTRRWSGSVRLRTGPVLEGPQRLWFVGLDGTMLDGRLQTDGRFDVRLPCGQYEARLAETTGLALGELDLSADTVHDLVVPGCVLSGTITYVGTKHPRADGPAREAVLALHGAEGAPSSAVLARSQRRYAFCGLEPGRYVLSSRPWVPVDAADGCVTIEIGPASDSVTYDLVITDP